MFKIMKDNKIVGVSENEPVLLDNYEVQEDTEHSVSDYMQINGEYVLTSSAEAIEQKEDDVRAVRNRYLEKYVDPKQLVLVWNSMAENEQKEYTDYRRYLLNYPETEGWYENPPKDFSTWKEMLTEEE